VRGQRGIEETGAAYREALIRWSEIGVRDPAKANAFADDANKQGDALAASDEGRAALRRLLADENPYVRVCTAMDCLQWWPREARGVLDEVSQTKGPGALEARLALRAYGNGSLPWQTG
jgi:hypothetical protein